MTTFTEAKSPAIAEQGARAEVLRAALIALTLGASIIFTVGFANSASVHDAAHDTRHAMAFPCH